MSGGTTFTVSLPKSWAEEQGIEPGSVLYLHPKSDGTLLIQSSREYTQTESAVEISPEEDDRTVRELVYAMYLIGLDRIKLVSDDSDQDLRQLESVVMDIVSRFVGFEILESSGDEIVLQTVMDAKNISIRKSGIRLRLIALAMHEDAVTAVVDNDVSLANQVIRHDDEVDKLLALITRYFQRTLTDLQEVEEVELTRPEMFEYYYISRQLERVADHAEKIARIVVDDAQLPSELVEELAPIADDSRAILRDASDVVLSDEDVQRAYDALYERDNVVEDIEELDRTIYDHDTSADLHRFSLVLDSLKRSVEYGANIAEVSIQRAARMGMID
ncbi:MAG: PhoU domain-containing protein [Halobacteria archaeon]|nr:PhoU domain-containing protein [Halobacteria archaeon]